MSMKLIISLALFLPLAECLARYYNRPDAGPTDHLLPSWDVDWWLENSWMGVFGAATASLTECRDLLVAEQQFPTQTLFDPERFNDTCDRLASDDDMVRVQQDISGLLVPSAEALAAAAAATGKSSFLDNLVETYDEEWTAMVPPGTGRVVGPRPEYTVGFRAEAFTAAQLAKLHAIDAAAVAVAAAEAANASTGTDTGAGARVNYTGLSFFRATPAIYFPFMSFCTATSHNYLNSSVWRDCVAGMVGGTRAVEQLHARLGRENETYRHIWAFSVSLVRDEVNVKGVTRDATELPMYKPEHLRGYALRNDSALARWDSFRFVKNVYETWAPRQLGRIRAMLDQIPLPGEPEPEPESKSKSELESESESESESRPELGQEL